MRTPDIRTGQSIFEVIVAVAIGAIIIGSSAAAIIVTLRSGSGSIASQKAYALAGELLTNVRSYSESDWASIYNQTKGSGTEYYLATVATSSVSDTLGIATGTEAISFVAGQDEGSINFTRWFSVENVIRNSNNWISGSGIGDPTTQKITARVSWQTGGETKQIDLVTYVSRIRTRSITFDDWSGSGGVTATVTRPTSDYYSITGATITASGTITY